MRSRRTCWARGAFTGWKNSYGGIKLFVIGKRKRFLDHIVGEAPALEEARALRALFTRARRSAVLALQDGRGSFRLAFGGEAIDDFVRDAARPEVVADLRRAELARQRPGALLGEALVGLLFFR